jgi:hypothetical protein
MPTDPSPTDPPSTDPSGPPLGAWALAAVLGCVAGVLMNRETGLTAREGVGVVSMFALPFLFGVVGGVLRPARPIRTALTLSMVSLAAATPLLGETVVCLVVLVPWHIVLTPPIAWMTAWIVRHSRPGTDAALVLLAFAGAGTAPLVDARLADPDDRETFADQVVIDAPRDEVWRSVERLRMDFTTPAPWLLRAALPRPTGIRGGGADVGDARRALFDNGVILATVVASDAPRSFDITLHVEESGPEFFDHWAVLDRSSFVLDALPDGRTRISHVTTYRPLAYPRWYFAPIEHALGGVVQRYMLEAYAAETWPADVARR